MKSAFTDLFIRRPVLALVVSLLILLVGLTMWLERATRVDDRPSSGKLRHATLPVLLVTAYADIREAVSAMRDGALNYLSKPIDLDELLASARRYFKRVDSLRGV